MDRKPMPYIPIESLKTQRVEVFLNDLQHRLDLLRNKHDTIFVECCDILQKIKEVSTETINKQQEIGRIISEFEELGLKDSPKDNTLKQKIIQKAGDVKRLREKFEKICTQNINEMIVRAKDSLNDMEELHLNSDNLKKLISPAELLSSSEDPNSELWNTIDSFYSLPNESVLDAPESLCLDQDEISKDVTD